MNEAPRPRKLDNK